MFAFKIVTVLAVATAAFAHPAFHARSGSCSTGTLQCCDSIAPSSSRNADDFGGILPIGLAGTNVPLGVNCNPIPVIAAASSGTCSTQAACCDGVNNEGETPIGVNCSPADTGV